MYNKKRIELIVKDWVKLKTGLELSDDTISQMVDDITETKQCDIHGVSNNEVAFCECGDRLMKQVNSTNMNCVNCGTTVKAK